MLVGEKHAAMNIFVKYIIFVLYIYIYIVVICICSYPGVSVIKNLSARQETQETKVRSLGQKDLCEEKMATQYVPGASQEQRTLGLYSP